MKMFRVSVIGKFSLNTLNKPSILRLSGVVSNWKNSLKDWICTSRRSGVSARCLIFPKLILFCNFVEDIFFKTGFLYFELPSFTVDNQRSTYSTSHQRSNKLGKRTAKIANIYKTAKKEIRLESLKIEAISFSVFRFDPGNPG